MRGGGSRTGDVSHHGEGDERSSPGTDFHVQRGQIGAKCGPGGHQAEVVCLQDVTLSEHSKAAAVADAKRREWTMIAGPSLESLETSRS